jgi:hypothetical protein
VQAELSPKRWFTCQLARGARMCHDQGTVRNLLRLDSSARWFTTLVVGFAAQACAVGEPLDEEVLMAAAAATNEPITADPDGAGGAGPGPVGPTPGGAGNPGNGGGPNGAAGDGPGPVGTGPGQTPGQPNTPSTNPPAPGTGPGPSTPTTMPTTTSTRLVPMMPTVTPSMTAPPEPTTVPSEEPSTATGGAGGMGGAGGAAGSGGSAGAEPAGPTPEQIAASDVVILYAPTSAQDTGNIAFRLKIRNQNAEEPLPLEQLTIRYWYTSGGIAMVFHNYYSGMLIMGPSAMVGTDGENEYVEISFAGGTISSTAEINQTETQVQLDGAYDQTDDWSFDAALMDDPNGRITAYRDGVLIWGEEPDGDMPE